MSSTITESTATTSATASSTVTESTSSATSTSTATTITTIWLRCSIVKSDGTASNIGTGLSLKSGLGIINGREGDVSEALGVTSLHISWKSDVDDSSVLTESLTDSVLISIEGQVAQEESVGGRVLGVAICLSTALSAVSWWCIRTRSGEVNIGLATINHATLLGLKSGSGRSRAGERNRNPWSDQWPCH